MELAAAIKELEANTAALECTYSGDTQASQSSLHSSSGYGTMNSTPATSEDPLATGGKCVADVKNQVVSAMFFWQPVLKKVNFHGVLFCVQTN